MSLRPHLDSLLIYDPHRSPSTANVWIARVLPNEEVALGKLFVVSMIDSADRLNHEIISLLQEELKLQYYQQVDTKADKAFESTLQRTNQRLHQLIADGVSAWVDRAHCLVGVLWRDEVYLATVGDMNCYLLRHDRFHDVLGPSTGQKPNPLRLFSQVVSGQLRLADRLLICTPTLLDYFSLEKLRRTMVDATPSECVHQWEATLLGVEQRSTFAAMVVQMMADAAALPILRREVQPQRFDNMPQASMEGLIAREQATQRLLSPSIWPAVRDFVGQITHLIQQLVRRYVLRKPPRRAVPHLVSDTTIVRSTAPTSLGWRAQLLLGLRHHIHRLTTSTANIVTRLRTSQTTAPTTVTPSLSYHTPRSTWSLSAMVRWFQQLSRRQQVLIGLGLVAVFFLAVSILPGNTPTTKTASAPSTTSQIQAALTKAQAALLYGGDLTAQQELATAQTLFHQLPNRSAHDKQVRSQLQAQLQTVILRVAHLTTVAQPTTLVNLATTSRQFQPRQLYLVGNHLATLDPDRSTVMSVGLDGSTPTALINTLDIGQVATGAVSGSSTILFSTNRRGFVELDLTKKTWKPLEASWPQPGSRVQSLAVYQNRAYALDTTNNQIIRFAKGATSLGTGVAWLKQAMTTIGQARAVVVNGSIFVLVPGGQVTEFQTGRPVTFQLATTTPALTDATRLWTDANSKNFYLLDPSQRRFLVFDATGKLVDQYQSPLWTDARDIVANEKTKTAYLLNGTTIYTVTLQH